MIAAKWPAPKNIKAFTTTREGGVSKSPFSSNNLGAHVGDCPNDVQKNRATLTTQLPNSPIWLNQTHSTDIFNINQTSLSSLIENPIVINADASFTKLTQTVCCVMTADCLPILVTNKNGDTVAAIHAGWRGLADGIIEKSIGVFNDKADDLLVWLGPAIGPTAFEVGNDVYNIFINIDASFSKAFTPCGKKYLANIYQLATLKLNMSGVTNIYGGNDCTYKNESLFYSFRRDGQTGRMASVIWIE